MFNRKPKQITEADITNFLYPVGKTKIKLTDEEIKELRPILTDEDIAEFRKFRLAQQAEWDADRIYRQAEVNAVAGRFKAQRVRAVDKARKV